MRLSRVLCVGTLFASLFACSPGQTPVLGETIHVALVPKDSVRTFRNRLAGRDAQIVATSEPVSLATASVAVRQDPSAPLHLVEGPLPAAPLPGELHRLGGFAVVAVPAGVDPHEHLGSHHYYAEPIGAREQNVPAARRERLLDGFSLDGTAIPPGERRLTSLDIDPAFLEAKLKEISGAVPVTLGGRTVTIAERRSVDGRTNARAWLRQQYETLGFTVRDVPYGDQRLLGGVNFVAERQGADPSRALLITAHYDTVATAGADDDGAGTVTALAIAKALKDTPIAVNLRIVGFDQEELGLVGSAAYAKALDQSGEIDKIVGVLNLEMTAFDSNDDGHFHVIDCDENTSADLTAKVNAAVARAPLRLTRIEACTNRSDHASFWRYGAPAIVVSENFFGGDGNPCYHRTCDKVDRANYDYMTRVTKAVGLAAADILTTGR